MTGSTIFVAGVYGTGKSTMCSALSERVRIPAFSAGDLISTINGERYGANKAVVDKDGNQILLAKRVRELHHEHGEIILAGHFCIFDTANRVEVLPESVYSALNITRIILLETDVQTIIAHLRRRDKKNYLEENISTLIEREHEQSEKISKQLKCPFDTCKMTFTDKDLDYVASLLF
ncbi:MAG: ATP-binding protein [Christensenellaceae bacterium]